MSDDGEAIMASISEAIYQFGNHGVERDRPYDGQPHTTDGERGKTMVSGLTFRDVCDCFVIGWLRANGKHALLDSPDVTYNDIYEHGGACDIDPIAAMQNMACEMERRMGIYPNVPRLTDA